VDRAPIDRAGVGARGEDVAWELYRSRGYRLLDRNWRCSLGELDLVLRRGDLTVFCEVKARRGARLGAGWEAVTARKRAKLRALALAYLLASGRDVDACRFDVASVAVLGDSVQVELFEDAF